MAGSRVIPNAEAALAERTAAYVRPGTRAQGDNRFGVPTFLWAGRNVDAPALLQQGPGAGSPQEAAARVHLGNYAGLYNLSAEDSRGASRPGL